MCSNALGMTPFKSLLVGTPDIVCVFPVPVCPYAKIVPIAVSNCRVAVDAIVSLKNTLHYGIDSLIVHLSLSGTD